MPSEHEIYFYLVYPIYTLPRLLYSRNLYTEDTFEESHNVLYLELSPCEDHVIIAPLPKNGNATEYDI